MVEGSEEIPRSEHPTPDAIRPYWYNLNGKWEFRFDERDEGVAAEWFKPDAEGFDLAIQVPFPWESSLSGVGRARGAPTIGWYRRSVTIPADFPSDQRIFLRFGAVDWQADVWLNGEKVASHEGGYTPFEADITDQIRRDAENTLVVRAYDPTDPSLPTGKQVGWYTPSSGIWQTVWLEARPAGRIKAFGFATQSLDPVVLVANVLVQPAEPGEYALTLRSDDDAIGSRTVSFATEKADAEPLVHSFLIPVRNAKLWTPETPHLYDLTLELKTPSGEIDTIATYTGLRTIGRGKYGDAPHESILLNGKPVYLRLALDQSFNPWGLYTAPSDEFLRQDLELAKSLGLNGLRIHIKSEEPRKLYWADKLGLLIMQDMPNTWRQNERARKAWEATMRETLVRDRNQPSIFAWVAFNETWGLGSPDEYKANRETQDWVRQMVGLMRTIDPTRLVEDNSPCNYDHLSVTDLNSWHFYIDDHEESRRHIEDVVRQSVPGSPFNHCPGEVMNSAPLINSEYGSVSAGGGDRDVSWGFRDLTTQLRKYPRIQGYVYTELSDIEWEHNGFVNYDRSPKVFGYDAFVPGMTVADLQGADFVGYDAPPAIVARPGEVVRVPIFVSHFSERQNPPKLRWWVSGVNDSGEIDQLPPREREVEWKPYDVTFQKPIAFKIDGPLVGALGLELVGAEGTRIAANFVNVVIRPESPAARVERIDDRQVALRFRPEDYAQASWSGGLAASEGKAAGRGEGRFLYKLRIPESVVRARPTSLRLRLELAARAGREKVDWPERVNAQDYPQTDTRQHPSSVAIWVGEHRLTGIALADDPADARGVLSHLNGRDHGSHGYRVDSEFALPEAVRAELEAGQPLLLRFEVPDSGQPVGGLAIFGATTGAFPFDPTLILRTETDLPADLGVDPAAEITIDTVASRRRVVLETGEGRDRPSWRYTTNQPGDGWTAIEFDDSSWETGAAGFGTRGTPGIRVGTRWNTPAIWLRTRVELPNFGEDSSFVLRLFHDEDCRIFVNGQPLLERSGYVTSYQDITLDAAQRGLFRAGENVIAVECRQTGGGQGIDLGLVVEASE
jgi:hypothetical protein